MTEFIVEIGLNHLGSEERARRMLESFWNSGADAVTFQIREPSFYESADPLRRRLSADFYRAAIDDTHARGKSFGIAIADEASVEAFAALGVDFWKTLSWDFKNDSLFQKLQGTGRRMLMSTGLSDEEEIVTGSARSGNFELIHTQLSQKIEEVNLKVIPEIRRRTGRAVAFGLHCANHDVTQLALGFEPSAIFFYVKEEGCAGLFDDEHAIPLAQLDLFVAKLSVLASSLGTGRKLGAEKPGWVAH